MAVPKEESAIKGIFTRTVTFLRNGGDIFVLQRLLGHSTLEMVNKYLDGLNDDDAAQAHRKFSPSDKMAIKGGA